uniref:Uncharacterized protein n=1 Tax=Ixodes ricinus TaxID=34613 RepID=A0A090XF15_IXORI
MEQIVQRNQYARQTSAHIQATSKIRQSLGRYRNEVSKLTAGLTAASDSFTVGEADRRKYMISTLVNKGREMEDLLTAKQGSTGQARRSELFRERLWGRGSQRGWLERGGDRGPRRGFDCRRDQKSSSRRYLREARSWSWRAVSPCCIWTFRRKLAIWLSIRNLLYTMKIIDDITDHTDRMRDCLVRETKKCSDSGQESPGTCWYWGCHSHF